MLPIRLSFVLVALLLPGMVWAESYYWGGQRSLTEIRQTTNETTGNFGYGSYDYWTDYRSFMNDNGCNTGVWRPCSMSDIRQAFANRVTGWSTLVNRAHIIGYDVSVVQDFDTAGPTTTNCSQWTSDSGHGLQFWPPGQVSGGLFGFVMGGCEKSAYLLCCR